MKTCTKCLKDKDEEDFKNILVKGRRRRATQCAECVAKIKRAHYDKNKEKYQEASRRYREANRERIPEMNKAYREANREDIAEKAKRYNSRPEVRSRLSDKEKERRKNPDYQFKRRARTAVNHAVRDGRLTNPGKCSKCGKEGYSEAHHEDYSKKLDVVWVCKKCHMEIHHSNEGHNS